MREADRLEIVTAVLCGDLSGHNARVYALVQEGIQAEQRRATALETLQAANSERSEPVRRAVHRAADRLLTEPRRRVTARRQWTGMLWQWLWLPERYKELGFERRPCKRVIRAALKDWTPPNGDVLSGASNWSSDRTKGGDRGE